MSCRMGVGRTGTMLSCILVSMGLTVKEALEKVRKERKQLEAFETSDQREAILTFAGRNNRVQPSSARGNKAILTN